MPEGYANPNVLVSTAWVAERLQDPKVRVLESNEDVLLYETGHVPGALKLDWHADLNDPVTRDFVDGPGFARLCSRLGIGPDTTAVFYGDRNNWWAAYAYWIFKLYGHRDCRVMNGGRAKWVEEGRPQTKDVPRVQTTDYPVPSAVDQKIRAFQDEVLAFIGAKRGDRSANLPASRALVDVRSPGEYSGQVTHMPDYPQEGVLRGGHIPGAQSIPWAQAANPDQTFKAADELRQLYAGKGVTGEKDVVVYCRIGERSSHTWFVLHELLGYPKVRNYDGSWTEWGNSVRVPIEK
ncbi:MAG TPA: sulfurtransferase [Chloroflexota bacterium]|jgi:thiosulfate/3-mercaptopyruvate sulfurtransferase|nr:sulfurtransferase [Chloroflexota bacterium]